jgi:hypothetical protein
MAIRITSYAIFVPGATFAATGSATLFPARTPIIPPVADLGECEDCGEELVSLLDNPNCVFCEYCECS